MKHITIICISVLIGAFIGFRANDEQLSNCEVQYIQALDDYYTCDINYTDLRMDCGGE